MMRAAQHPDAPPVASRLHEMGVGHSVALAMTNLPPTTEPASSTEVPPELLEVGVYRSAAEGFEHGLVVLATGGAYWLMPDSEGHFRLFVEAANRDRVSEQLRRFDRECVGWPPKPLPDVAVIRRVELVIPLLWALTVIAVYWGQLRFPGWTNAGALGSDEIFHQHEWWRAGTALFLHADPSHLTANLLSGVFAFAAVLSSFGRLRGCLVLSVSAIGANILSAALQRDVGYHSIGASTAVFAAVGLLTGRGIRRMFSLPRRYRLRAMFVPLASGATVVALYGVGGVQVDVVAHVTGFITGLLVGFIAMPRPQLPAT